jgi:hypothetical protein
MNIIEATVEFDLFCDWQNEPPVYRLYIDEEMFAERTYIWKGVEYLHENIPIKCEAGTYRIRIENLGEGEFRVRNPGGTPNLHWYDNLTFKVT